jgi:hypothetical protein
MYLPERQAGLEEEMGTLLKLILRSNLLAKKKEKHLSQLSDILEGDGMTILLYYQWRCRVFVVLLFCFLRITNAVDDTPVFLLVRDNKAFGTSPDEYASSINKSATGLSPQKSSSRRSRNKSLSTSDVNMLSAASRSVGSDSGDRNRSNSRGSDDSHNPSRRSQEPGTWLTSFLSLLYFI